MISNQHQTEEVVAGLVLMIDERVRKGTFEYSDIVAILQTSPHNFKQSWAYKVAKRAYDQYKELLKEQVNDSLGEALVVLNMIRNRAMKQDDLTNAIQAQKEINKILGLHQQNINITTDIPYTVVFGGESPVQIPIHPVNRLDSGEIDNFFEDLE